MSREGHLSEGLESLWPRQEWRLDGGSRGLGSALVTGHRGECTAWELSVLGWAVGSLGLWVLSRGEAGVGWSVEENAGGARSDGGAAGSIPPPPPRGGRCSLRLPGGTGRGRASGLFWLELWAELPSLF